MRRLWISVVTGGLAGSLFGCPSPPRDAVPAAAVVARDDRPARTEPPAPSKGGEPEVVVAAAGRAATPVSIDGLDPAQRRRYSAALDEGRRLHRAGDHAAAVKAFGRALDVVPDDPRALSEQGWAALFAEQLDLARDALDRAVKSPIDDERLLASVLYNRARVAEAQGRTADAIADYQRSLQLRPHPAAYRHLTALEGGSRYRFGPATAAMQGPYRRLQQFCGQERRVVAGAPTDEAAPPDQAPLLCTADASRGTVSAAVRVPATRELPEPWRGARFVEVHPDPFTAQLHAALRTDRGWYVLPDVATWARDTPGTQETATALHASVERTSGGAARVVFEVETRVADLDGAGDAAAERTAELHRVAFVCGAASGVPQCTGALPVSGQLSQSGEVVSKWAVERSTDAAGAIVLSGEPAQLDAPIAALLGTHAVEL